LWQQKIKAVRLERKTKPNDAASATPTTDGTNVYALFSGFGLVAYSWNGEERWRRSLGPFNPHHGMASSPILAQGNVMVLADQVSASHIAAFDAASGQERWRTPRGDFVGGYGTPILMGSDVVVSGPIEMVAYAAANGERRWSIPRMGVMPVSSPISEANRIFAYNDAVPPFESLAREMKGDRNGDGKLEPDEFPDPSFREAVLAIDRNYGNGDGAIDQKEWDGALRLMNTMNAFVAARIEGVQATELWRTTKMLANAASPLLYQNILYLVRNGGILSTVDPAKGEVLRQERVPGFEGNLFASPVAADGKIYLLNEVGQLAVIAAGLEMRPLQVNDLHDACYATPALAEETILVRSEHALWAFRKKGQNSQRP
jgi:outer membrane protein assembly factor BamB